MNLHAPYRFKQPPTPEVVEFLVAAQRRGTIYKPLADNVYDLRRQIAETRRYLREDTALAASGKWTTTFSTEDGFRFASERDRTALLRELARMSTQLNECDRAVAELQRDACYPCEMRRCPRCHYRVEAATVAWSTDRRMLLHHMAGGMHCSGTGALVPA